MKKTRMYERGAAHILAIVVFVLLLGVVGFVGYNAWQKQSTNAGSRPILGASYDANNPATYKYGANNLCRIYHTLHMKLTVADKVKPKYEILSNGKRILYVDTATQKAGTRYFSSSRFEGSFETATVTYVAKTPTVRTEKVKAKNGKITTVTKTIWTDNTSTVAVRDLPRCVPTSDVSEFNFYGGGSDGITNVCMNNGEIVFRWMSASKAPASTQPKLIAAIDGKTVKTINVSNDKINTFYYSRVPSKGGQFKLSFTDNKNYKGSKARVLVNRAINTIKSCL